MSFIDKALEKARGSQGREETIPSQGEGVPESAPPEPGAEDRALRSPLLDGEIHYTVTRTVPIDPDTLRRRRIIAGRDNGLITEEYKLLRTQILQRTKAENRNTLMLTGPLPGEGKTLTAINLGLSIAQEMDKTVLLVDADLRRPRVHRYFGLPEGPGLVDYFTSGTPIPELLVHPEGFSKFVILPGGQPKPEAAELIGSPLMTELVKELKHFYPDRYVLFDLPPLLSYADSLVFAPQMDGIILVVEMAKTPREAVQQCLKMLDGLPLLGCVLNKMNEKNERDEVYHYYTYRNNGHPLGKSWLRRWFK